MGASDVQCVVLILVDGDLEDDVLRFRAVALISVVFNDDNPIRL